MASTDAIPRQRTAIRRFQYSKPISLTVAHRLIREDCTVLDYDCGRGEDVGLLQKNGLQAEGWDPYFRPDAPLKPADVVNLGYVDSTLSEYSILYFDVCMGLSLICEGRCCLLREHTRGHPVHGSIIGRNRYCYPTCPSTERHSAIRSNPGASNNAWPTSQPNEHA